MDEKRVIIDKDLKETIVKLLSDAEVLLQIVSNLQDVRYLYLTNAEFDLDKFISKEEELENKLQMIDIG